MATIVQTVGGAGKTAFSLSGTENGAALYKIRVWMSKSWVVSIRVWLTDGRVQVFGFSHGPFTEFKFEGGEEFTSLTLWKSKDGGHVGGIQFKTSKDREFSSKVEDRYLGQEVIMDIGSGICLGVTGTYSMDLNSLGFIFLQAIQFSQVTNVKYPTLSGTVPTVAMEEMRYMVYENSSGDTQEFRMEVTCKWDSSSEWSMCNSIDETFACKVKAAIPELKQSGQGYILVLGPEEFHPLCSHESITRSFTENVQVSPGQTKRIKAQMGKAHIQLQYKGMLEIHCKGGAKMEIEIKGVYKGLASTEMIFTE